MAQTTRMVIVLFLGLALPAAAFIGIVHLASPQLPAEVRISHVEGISPHKVLSFQEFAALPLALREAILLAIDTGFASVPADATVARAVRDLGATGTSDLIVVVNGAEVMLTVILKEDRLETAKHLAGQARDAAIGLWERWT